jgi:hypothetical protein
LVHQLQLIKDLLSAPITALVDDSSKIKEILEQIETQLPESLQVKLWPAGHLLFFLAEVKAAQQRIEARRSQVSLKTDIAQKCKALNQKKATLDAKDDFSENTRLIQEEKASIANSKQEVQEMTEQIQAEFAEISTLSRQIISGDEKDDEEIIARADAVCAEAIHAIERLLN